MGLSLLHANGKLKEGAFAVHKEKGKPLAVATVSTAGKARVHLAGGDCFPD